MKNFDFGQIFVKFQFRSKVSKIIDFFFKFRKLSIRINFSNNFAFGKIFEKFRFCSYFRNITFLVKFSKKNFDFDQNFRKFSKMSILVKFSKIFDFGQIIEKFRFWWNFSKSSILVKFSKYYVIGQIFEKKFDFDQNLENFEKCRF